MAPRFVTTDRVAKGLHVQRLRGLGTATREAAGRDDLRRVIPAARLIHPSLHPILHGNSHATWRSWCSALCRRFSFSSCWWCCIRRHRVERPLERTLAERRARTSGAVEQARGAIAAAEAETTAYEEKLRAARVGNHGAERERRLQAVAAAARCGARSRPRGCAGTGARRSPADRRDLCRRPHARLKTATALLSEQILKAVLSRYGEALGGYALMHSSTSWPRHRRLIVCILGVALSLRRRGSPPCPDAAAGRGQRRRKHNARQHRASEESGAAR
jgi:F-type H+-transporting ATPase subunit b